MKTSRFLGAAVLCCACSAAALAADWAQWRGPGRDGISKEAALLPEWPKAGPKLVWQIDNAGSGYGAAAVAGGRVYLVSNKGLNNEFVAAHDAADGKLLWTSQLGAVGNPQQQPPYAAARSTPTVEGDVLYAFSSDGDIACLETAKGAVRWQKNVRKEFGGLPGVWAYSESPLVDGDLVVCSPGGPKAALVALDKKTGAVVWQCAVPGSDQAAYASVIAVEAAGVKQYVQLLAAGAVGVDAKTGKFLWRYDKTGKGSPANMPTPVVSGNLVYTVGARTGGGLVSLKAKPGGVAAEEVYFDRNLPSSIGGSVLVNGHLYGTTAADGLLCVEFATGTVKWKDASIGAASLLYAAGRLYLYGENGQLALVEASPEAYREKGRFTPAGQPKRTQPSERSWAYPALADGRLYVRDNNVVWCYDVTAAK